MSQQVAVETGPQYQVARFKLMLSCYNCRRPSSRYLAQVPEEITTADELQDSGILQQQRFLCPKCESTIGAITGIKVEWIDVPY